MPMVSTSGRGYTPAAIAAPLVSSVACLKAWGRCGLLLGANLGLVLGALAVAILFTGESSAFGILGMLLAVAVVCAFLASASAVLAAALYNKTTSQRRLA